MSTLVLILHPRFDWFRELVTVVFTRDTKSVKDSASASDIVVMLNVTVVVLNANVSLLTSSFSARSQAPATPPLSRR